MEGVAGENVWEVGGVRVSGTRISKVLSPAQSHHPPPLQNHNQDLMHRHQHHSSSMAAFGSRGERTTAKQLSPHSLQPLRQLFPGNAGLHRRAVGAVHVDSP
jgi:hypothetical protein